MTKTQSQTMEDLGVLKSDLGKVKDDLSSLAGTIMNGGRTSASAVCENVRGRFNSSMESVGAFVEERPVTTVLMAFGAGMVAAMLLRRR